MGHRVRRPALRHQRGQVTMISYLVETSHNGVAWTPETTTTGLLSLSRAEDHVDTLAPRLYARITRVETGEIKSWSYPASFDMSDAIRDLTT